MASMISAATSTSAAVRNTMNASQGLVLNGTQTYTQTGGTFTTNGLIELANGGGSAR